MATIFLNAPTTELYAETLHFYQLLGMKIVSKFDQSAHLHLFSDPSFSLSVHLQPAPYSLDTLQARRRDLNEILKKENVDEIASFRSLSFGVDNLAVSFP